MHLGAMWAQPDLCGCTGVAWDVALALVPGHSSEQLAWQEQLEPVSSGLPGLQVQQMWAAGIVQVGVMQVVLLRSGVLSEHVVWQLCTTWDSVGCFDTACCERCLCMQQYVEPLLVHTVTAVLW